MLNKDKYKEDIIKIAMEGGILAVSKVDNSLVPCDSMDCWDCKFYDVEDCNVSRKEWLNSEYEEPKRVFTEEQKNFIRVCDKVKYIARNMAGRLYSYCFKPEKYQTFWQDHARTATSLCDLSNIDFPQIKWEDEEPTSREEILGE